MGRGPGPQFLLRAVSAHGSLRRLAGYGRSAGRTTVTSQVLLPKTVVNEYLIKDADPPAGRTARSISTGTRPGYGSRRSESGHRR